MSAADQCASRRDKGTAQCNASSVVFDSALPAGSSDMLVLYAVYHPKPPRPHQPDITDSSCGRARGDEIHQKLQRRILEGDWPWL
jgi:hypothetical protein